MTLSLLKHWQVLHVSGQLTDNNQKRIVIIGAGIAGLSTAFLLRDFGRKNGFQFDLKILESAQRHGGATRTDISEGYLCEWGPNGFLDNEPTTFDLVKKLELDSELVKANENSNKRYIFHGGALRKLPMAPPAFLVSDILPLPSRLRVLMEFFIAKKTKNSDETVDSFARRRLGDGFAKYLLDPMVSGIFAGNTKELSLKSVFPKMVEMEREHGGLFKAMIAKKAAAKKYNTTSGGPSGPNAILHTFKTGMGHLTDTLADSLSGSIKLNQPVTSVNRENGKFRVFVEKRSFEADFVILACPSFAAADMIKDISNPVSDAIRGIYHAPVDVVCHGHHSSGSEFDPNGFGVLIPRSEGIRSLGTLWSNSIFPGQAPNGDFLLRTIIGGAHDPQIVELNEDLLHRTAAQDHKLVMGIQSEAIFKQVFRHKKGIAQYNIGHSIKVAASEQLEKDLPGLYFTGASYRGVSVNGCIKDAFRIANDFKKLVGKCQ